MFLTGLFDVTALFAVYNTADNKPVAPEEWALQRFPEMYVTIDNVIPLYFAEKLYAGADHRALVGDWHSSDRPPLQSALVLVQRPLMGLGGLPVGLHYQLLGTILQCAWVPAAWALCRSAGLAGCRLALALAMLLTSGFFFFHAVFVWP